MDNKKPYFRKEEKLLSEETIDSWAKVLKYEVTYYIYLNQTDTTIKPLICK